jgi:hypothetical protein
MAWTYPLWQRGAFTLNHYLLSGTCTVFVFLQVSTITCCACGKMVVAMRRQGRVSDQQRRSCLPQNIDPFMK